MTGAKRSPYPGYPGGAAHWIKGSRTSPAKKLERASNKQERRSRKKEREKRHGLSVFTCLELWGKYSLRVSLLRVGAKHSFRSRESKSLFTFKYK